jgi:hypothetical protein
MIMLLLLLSHNLKRKTGIINLWTLQPNLLTNPVILPQQLPHVLVLLVQVAHPALQVTDVVLTILRKTIAGVHTLNHNLNICNNLGFQVPCYLYKRKQATG